MKAIKYIFVAVVMVLCVISLIIMAILNTLGKVIITITEFMAVTIGKIGESCQKRLRE